MTDESTEQTRIVSTQREAWGLDEMHYFFAALRSGSYAYDPLDLRREPNPDRKRGYRRRERQ